MFSLIAHGLLVGAPNFKAIWKRCAALRHGQRQALGLNVRNKHAENLLQDRPVDLVGELERGHGRFEIRDITIAAVDTEVSPFPHIARIIKGARIYRDGKESAEPEMSVRLFGTSHRYGSKTAGHRMCNGLCVIEPSTAALAITPAARNLCGSCL